MCDDGCLQLRLDTNGLASGVNVGGGERGSGEVAVAAAHSVGGGSAGSDEAGEDSCGADDGRHFERCVCDLLVGDVNELMRLFVFGWYVLEDGRKEEGGSGSQEMDGLKKGLTPTRGAPAAVAKSTK